MSFELNEQALRLLQCEAQLEIVPGATHLFEEPGTLEQVADPGAADGSAAGWLDSNAVPLLIRSSAGPLMFTIVGQLPDSARRPFGRPLRSSAAREGIHVAPRGLTRRDLLKNSGAAIGGFAITGTMLEPGEARAALGCEGNCYPPADEADRQRYSYFQKQLPGLKYYQDRGGFLSANYPPLEPDEMRISFMGSTIPPTRRVQQMMSIFVEVGWDPVRKRAKDQFVFDCGTGVVANYGAMEVGFGRMDKIFLTHLHGDHLSDVTHVYCFGPASDRLSPLYIWGPGPSGVPNPKAPHQLYDDGTKAYCSHLRDALRWHTESFSFQPTTYAAPYPTASEIKEKWGLPLMPAAVSDDPWGDAYAMVPIELDWSKVGGVAYDNKETGVKITHFPVIHCRKGSIAYKLEWNGLSMIFSGDTKPERISIEQAKNAGRGVTVFDPRDGGPRRDLGHAGTAPAEAAPARSQPALGRTPWTGRSQCRTVHTRRRVPSGTC